ncbi:rRNA maturation RNase YbeY [bacterium]|nr:rRNA maturation RNase YbeY [bacterium]
MKIINIFTENLYTSWNVDEKDVIVKTKKLLQHYLDTLTGETCLKDYSFQSLTLDILFCDSKKTHQLNKEYRNKDYPADIITFAIFADDDSRFVFDGDINLGEIVIALDKVMELSNAEVSCAKNKEQELYFLISHGLMHLLGFDHTEESEYNFVIREQRKALECINYEQI